MTVLVLTRPLMDPISDLVISELSSRDVPVVRLDPADFPACLVMSARLDPGQQSWRGVWRGEHRNVDLDGVRAVYYRRPGRFQLDQRMSSAAARWADSEARFAIGGVLSSLSCTWVNHPHHNALAAFAPHALAVAARCGLLIPSTLITSDPEEARDFVANQPGEVAAYKAVGTAPAGTHEGQKLALWTTKVRPDEVTEAVSLTAHQFQRWVDKAYEVRLTAVDDQMFSAEIHAGSAASREDFRRDYPSLTYKVCRTPGSVAGGARKLMSALQLRYCAMDFLVSHDDRWHLVDINPTGQYGFIPELQAPITHALANLLEGPER